MLPDSVDLLVVGGGVHGAAIARDAAARGLSVALVEKRDFGWGTSSRSSKLAHGGLRYLERLQLGLVRESLHERDVLLEMAPHLAWPLPFLIPLSGPKPRAGWKVRAGLFAYGLLAGHSPLAGHRVLDEAEALALAPGLAGSGTDRVAEYRDAGMDDQRIVIELVLDAASLGAACANHAEAIALLRDGGSVAGARVRQGDTTREVRAATTVLACGPWTDAVAPRTALPRLVLTQGVHLFVRRALVRAAALLLASPRDGRIFFVIPWKGGSLVGTTDTPFQPPPDAARASAEDVRYLLEAVGACLPGVPVGLEDVIAVQAGVRPLVSRGRAGDPSAIGRDYELDWSQPGLCVVEGGKYTIFRKLAEDVVDRVADAVRARDSSRHLAACTTRTRRLPGAAGAPWPEARVLLAGALVRQGVAAESIEHLIATYGVRAEGVVAAAAGESTLLRPACADHPHLRIEAVHAVRAERAVTPADVLLRRLALGWTACGGLRCLEAWRGALVRAGLAADAMEEGLGAFEEELAREWRLHWPPEPARA